MSHQTITPHCTMAGLKAVLQRYRPWVAMFEAGWSLEKIASTWSTEAHPLSAADVETALDELTQQAPPLPRSLPPLPENEAKCTEWRQHLRELAARGWSQEALDRITGGIYSPEFLAELIGQSKLTRKSRSKLDPSRRCPCPCKRLLKGRQMYATDACRKKVARKRMHSFA
jgi:hypothetical protein